MAAAAGQRRPLLKLALPVGRRLVLGSQAGRLRLGADLADAEVAAAADGRRGCVLRGGRGHGGRVERAGGGVVRRGEHGRGGRRRALARRERHHFPEEVCMEENTDSIQLNNSDVITKF